MSSLSVRPGIMEIAPYQGGASASAGGIKLSSNENVLGPSPRARAAYAAEAGNLHLYPAGGAKALRDAIAEAHDLAAENIVCGAGSDELISLLCQAFLEPGDEAIHTEHGFLMYAISTRAVGGVPVVAGEKKLTADPEAILEAVTEKTRIVFLANPNNPTGTLLPASAVKKFRAALPQRILLVLDSAYAEFVEDPAYDAGEELVLQTDNTVMLRTFSKIYGLAALRLGWAFASDQVVDVLNRVRGPFNVSAPAQAAGVAAVSDMDFLARSRAMNAEGRRRLHEGLFRLGIAGPASAGNFVLARFPDGEAQAVAADSTLRESGIIVRRISAYGLADCLRITVGLPEMVESVLATLETFMGEWT